MLPQYERLDAAQPVFRLPFNKVAYAVVCLPLGALLFCVTWCLLFEFERSTFTHCDVPNYLPSLSAAIGNYDPQRLIWQLAIIVHTPVRLAVARLYYRHFRDVVRRNRRVFGTIACMLNVVEVCALLGLSLWTSSDHYSSHRNCFITFIACSELYMLIVYFLLKNGRKMPLLPHEEKSLKYKLYFFLANILCFTAAGYCFVRHNARCEPGVYTFFALFEYMVVLTNMAYHMTACLDFHLSHLMFDWRNGLHLTQWKL